MWKALSPRSKPSLMVAEVIEESANMTVLAERGPGTSHGTAVRRHVSPPAVTSGCQSRADASERIILVKGLVQRANVTGVEFALPTAIASIRRDQHGWNRPREVDRR